MLITHLNTYVGTERGCVDVGSIKLDGFVMMEKADYEKLLTGIHPRMVEILEHTLTALITPQGEFKTKKAEAAYYEILHEILGR